MEVQRLHVLGEPTHILEDEMLATRNEKVLTIPVQKDIFVRNSDMWQSLTPPHFGGCFLHVPVGSDT